RVVHRPASPAALVVRQGGVRVARRQEVRVARRPGVHPRAYRAVRRPVLAPIGLQAARPPDSNVNSCGLRPSPPAGVWPLPRRMDRIAAMMVRATLHMKVKDGRGGDFEREWRAIAEEVRKAPGNLRQALTRDLDDPDSFTVTSDWSSREAFGEFERSPEQDELTAPLRELRASAHMTVHELVTYIEG